MKVTLKNILTGFGLGSALFVIAGIIFDMVSSGTFELSNWSYTKMAVGSILIGIGFSVPSAIYDNDKFSLGLQTLIHMGLGCIVLLLVAFNVGWIPIAAGWPAILLAVLGQLVIAFLLWLVFAFHYKQLAQKMNDRIQRMRDQ